MCPKKVPDTKTDKPTDSQSQHQLNSIMEQNRIEAGYNTSTAAVRGQREITGKFLHLNRVICESSILHESFHRNYTFTYT
jgi:hypothetical protein